MWIAEIFHSIQGEGRLVGQPSAFVRTSGCNLRCWFCDTPYTSWQPAGDQLSIDQILRRLESYPTRHAVVTGGEPLLSPEVVDLCRALKERAYHVTIETAATIDRPVVCDLMSLSPKLANSTPWRFDGGKEAALHDSRRIVPATIRRFVRDYDYQVKFVIDEPADIDEVTAFLRDYPQIDPERVYLMPQATEREPLVAKYKWLGQACEKLGYRLGQRLHIEMYGNRRGT
jgi:7-carboxy-7-deazaguanine synthase